jgi:acyl-CoA thioester hydrolase
MISLITKLRARYQETDRMGVVYHSNYFVWFEIGRTELFRKIGISYPELEKNGYFLVVTEVSCKYKAPATYDDELDVTTQVEVKNG